MLSGLIPRFKRWRAKRREFAIRRALHERRGDGPEAVFMDTPRAHGRGMSDMAGDR
jgi:hypothetical protein